MTDKKETSGKIVGSTDELGGTEERTEGWGGLDNARDAHYFRDGKSLCARWLAFGGPRWERYQELGKEPTRGSGTCKACWRKDELPYYQ